jgi:hypothetical protein
MSGDSETAAHRQQDLYFTELFQLAVQCRYMRRYRNVLARRVRQLEILRAVASSGAIATWAVVRSYPMVWATIIAASQLSDVLKDAIPFTGRHKAASGLVVSLDALLIEALNEWESVYGGQFTNEEITERRRKLMELRHNAEVEHFPTGDLPERGDLLTLAEEDAVAYFEAMFEPVASAYFERTERPTR